MNPFLAALGFGPDDRVVIFHGDDLGMCHAVNTAFADITAAAPVACGSIMVPCPWFNEMAEFARRHPEADIGVHTTLTSEWSHYRWRPLSTCDPQSGLLDDQGYLWADVESLHAHMDPDAAVAEIGAQVERALSAGIDVTHIDTHMGAIVHPTLAAAYVQLGLTYQVPVMLPRLSEEVMARHKIPPETAQTLTALMDKLEQTGQLPLVDHLTSLYEGQAENRREQYQRLVQTLPPGLTHLIYHAAQAGPEIEAIAPEKDWRGRAADHETFSNPAFWEWLAANGIHVIGYRTLRDAMRAGVKC